MKRPLLTVCLITYNQSEYVKEALDSILCQETDFVWELVIADDYSTDGTREILKNYQQRYPERIHLLLQAHNVGPEKNWLDLLSYPKTEYVLYAEGDDYFTDEHKLQTQVDFLEKHDDFSMCFHPVKVVYEDGSKPPSLFPIPEVRFNKSVLSLKDLLDHNFIQTNSAMYRWRFSNKKIKDTFPSGIAPGDWYLHALHAQSGKIGLINKAMAVYRRHPGGLWWESDKQLDNIWRKYGIAHLRLYTELLRLYGPERDAEDIIARNVQRVIDSLYTMDTDHNEGLVRAAVLEVPDAVVLYIRSVQNTDLEQKKDFQALQKELKTFIDVLAVRDEELRLIKTSRTWRARNSVARLVGKDQRNKR